MQERQRRASATADVVHLALHVDDEDVVAQSPFRGSGFDLGEVDAAEGELLQDQQQGSRLVLDDLAHDRGLVRFEPVLSLPLPGQEHETGLVVLVILDVGLEHGAAVALAGQLVADRSPRLLRRRDPFDRVGSGVRGFDLSPGQVLPQPTTTLGIGMRVRIHLGDLLQSHPGAGEEAVADSVLHLTDDLQVVDLVGEDVDGGRDRALDGVLDGDDGAVDLAARNRLYGVLHGRIGHDSGACDRRAAPRPGWLGEPLR